MLKTKRTWEGNIKMDLKELDVRLWMNRDQRRAFAITAMKLRVQ
jgi:hypothetical protein